MMAQSLRLRNIVLYLVLIGLIFQETDAWRRRRRRRSPPPPPPPDTTAPTFTSCAGNLGNQYTTSTTRTVTWSTPTATDNRGTPSVARTYGPASGSSFSEGSHTIRYTATDGAGNTATCTITFAVVVIRCPSLPSPGHGSVSCTNSRNVGSRCTYSCSTGYRLNGGSSSRICTASGTTASWPGSAPTCTRITCSPLSGPSHGSVTCTDGSYFNSVCTYSCDSGYTLQTGSTTQTCLSTSSWSGSTPSCVDTTAPSFSRCSSSQTIYAFNLATSATATWTTPAVSDNSGESISPTLAQGLASGSRFNEGVHPIRYTAEDSAGNSAECSFSITIAVVRCSSLSGTSPLQVSCPNGNIRGSVCTYSCSTGYRLQGQGSTQCQRTGSSGSWSNAAPSCQILQCPNLQAPQHGSIVGSCSSNYGSTCRFACNVGYEINNNQRRCTVQPGSTEAFWEGAVPVCARIHCTKPSLTTALQISATGACPAGSQVPSGNQCVFSCSTGYYLQGQATLTCQHDRTWNYPTPSCHVITCAATDLPAPINGEKRGCSNARENYGTVCTLACDVGYLPSTPVQRTCTDDGNGDGDGVWNGDTIECTIVTCPALPAPANGAVSSCNYGGALQDVTVRQKYSATCAYGCSIGFTRTGGSASRVCQASGNWDADPATCQDNTPPVLTCPSNKQLIAGSLSTAASVPWTDWEPLMGTDRGSPLLATLYTIDSSEVSSDDVPAVFTEGTHTLVYRATDLAGNVESCSFNVRVQVTRCPPLPAPADGTITLTAGEGTCVGGAIFGSTCRIACDVGHRLSISGTAAVNTCERDSDSPLLGVWSGPQVTCNIKNCTVPEVTNGYVVDCTTSTVTYGTSCHFSCTPGYTTPSGVETWSRSCEADETWNGDDLQCSVVKTCPARFDFPYGQAVPSECTTSDTVRFGTTCTFSCDPGFQLQGPTTLSCTTEGEWNQNDVLSCLDIQPPTFGISCPLRITDVAPRGYLTTRVFYDEPVPSDNSGVVNITRLDHSLGPGSMFSEGVTTIGYEATDSTGLSTRCDVIITVNVHRCSPQQPPNHGSVTGCPDPFYGSQCTFSCDVGYDLTGNTTLTCELTTGGDPVWSQDAPVCQIRTCPALPVTAPATLSGCGHSPSGVETFGTVCTFHCPYGYHGDGESQKRCLADRSWSSTDFTCHRKPCAPLVESASIAIAPATCLSDPRYGDTCNLACRTPGFEISPSNLQDTTCSGNETWTKNIQPAVCIDIASPIFDECPSNILSYADRSSNQTNVEWTIRTSDNSGVDPQVTCNLSPGVLTVGTHQVTCDARDDAGNEATCSFGVDVRVRHCADLHPPMFGTVVGSCDTAYGSVCHVTCLVGYSLVGSSELSCEFDGTDMYWGTDEQPVCEVIGCSPLLILSNVVVMPQSCVTSDKVHAGTVCTMHCQDDLQLTGDSQPITCLPGGEWSRTLDTYSLNCVDLVAPTIVSCPSEPIMVTRTEILGVQVTFDPPTASDNWDSELHLVTHPSDLVSPYNFTADTTCNYTFIDSANNSASCVFQVFISNQVQPVVQYCPADQNITSSTEMTSVSFEMPSFVDIPGNKLIVSCNHITSPVLLPFGSHQIICLATDSESGLRAECRININITPVPCIDLSIPSHGALACDDGFAYGRYCTMMCDTRYDVPRLRSNLAPQKIFVCGASGSWHPHSNVPDCSVLKNPRRFNLPLDIMYFSGKCAINDEQTRQEISQKYIDIVKQTDFAEVCTKNSLCTADHVEVTCGPGNARRKRSVVNEQLLAGADVNNIGDHVTVVSMTLGLTPADGHDQLHTMNQDGIPGQQHHRRLVELAQQIHSKIKDHWFVSNRGHQTGEGSNDVDSVLMHDAVTVECEEGYIPNHEDHTCVACPTGHYFDGTAVECIQCEVGFYQDEQAQSECKPCVDGTTTREIGAKHPSQCQVQCEQGHYSVTGFAPCVQCEQGGYQPLPGQTECFECPVGLTTPSSGSTTMEDCQEPCPPGQFSPSGFHPCLTCPLGSYQPHQQRTTCKKCGGNTTTTSEAATTIEQCHVII